MDLAFTPDELKFRDEIRAWVKANLPPAIAAKVHKAQTLTRDDQQTWAKILGKQGWLGYGWPKQFGGPGWPAPWAKATWTAAPVWAFPWLPSSTPTKCWPNWPKAQKNKRKPLNFKQICHLTLTQ